MENVGIVEFNVAVENVTNLKVHFVACNAQQSGNFFINTLQNVLFMSRVLSCNFLVVCKGHFISKYVIVIFGVPLNPNIDVGL